MILWQANILLRANIGRRSTNKICFSSLYCHLCPFTSPARCLFELSMSKTALLFLFLNRKHVIGFKTWQVSHRSWPHHFWVYHLLLQLGVTTYILFLHTQQPWHSTILIWWNVQKTYVEISYAISKGGGCYIMHNWIIYLQGFLGANECVHICAYGNKSFHLAGAQLSSNLELNASQLCVFKAVKANECLSFLP